MLANNVPVFLTPDSGWNEKQCRTVNVIARTMRNAFSAKARQKQQDKPEVIRIVESKYNRVLNLRDYWYGDYFSMSFILNPAGMTEGITYDLATLKANPIVLEYEGSHSSTNPNKFLSSLGIISVATKDGKYVLQFKCSSSDFPESSGARVQFSVYVGGRTK